MLSASSRNKDWETVAEAAAPDVEVMEATGQSAPATGSTDSLIDSGTDVNEALCEYKVADSAPLSGPLNLYSLMRL